jgi:hypothetical protein
MAKTAEGVHFLAGVKTLRSGTTGSVRANGAIGRRSVADLTRHPPQFPGAREGSMSLLEAPRALAQVVYRWQLEGLGVIGCRFKFRSRDLVVGFGTPRCVRPRCG